MFSIVVRRIIFALWTQILGHVCRVLEGQWHWIFKTFVFKCLAKLVCFEARSAGRHVYLSSKCIHVVSILSLSLGGKGVTLLDLRNVSLVQVWIEHCHGQMVFGFGSIHMFLARFILLYHYLSLLVWVRRWKVAVYNVLGGHQRKTVNCVIRLTCQLAVICIHHLLLLLKTPHFFYPLLQILVRDSLVCFRLKVVLRRKSSALSLVKHGEVRAGNVVGGHVRSCWWV